jgi:hypothetical protein
LNDKLNPKLPLGGQTWDQFFERADSKSSSDNVFDFCQKRPRDVLTYCEFAVEIAQSQKHIQVAIEDMQAARRRFSDNRLKDLGDEYSENFTHLDYVLNCFYGLGREFTINGLTAYITKLIVDSEVQKRCKWLYCYTSPERFAELLYAIGFVGLKEDGIIRFRSLGSQGSKPPAIGSSTRIVIHPSYCDALNLQDVVIDGLADDWELRQSGLLVDVPGAISRDEYFQSLVQLQDRLKVLSEGVDQAAAFEDLVGDVIRLCFFQWLGNIEAKSRDVSGRVIRDWVASNVASGGFWEAMRQRYGALNVVWECKNYATLDASDFHQANYYISELTGLVIIAYRGVREEKKHYLEHIRRISSQHQGRGIVLLVNDQDMQTFIRQSLRGKFRDSHIREIYDLIVRAIG